MRFVTPRGTRTYVTSRMTCGRVKVDDEVRSGWPWLSSTSAFPFHTRTCARRTEHTFKGS